MAQITKRASLFEQRKLRNSSNDSRSISTMTCSLPAGDAASSKRFEIAGFHLQVVIELVAAIGHRQRRSARKQYFNFAHSGVADFVFSKLGEIVFDRLCESRVCIDRPNFVSEIKHFGFLEAPKK
jgi:hypothetical protein